MNIEIYAKSDTNGMIEVTVFAEDGVHMDKIIKALRRQADSLEKQMTAIIQRKTDPDKKLADLNLQKGLLWSDLMQHLDNVKH